MSEPEKTTRRWQLPVAAGLSAIGLGLSFWLTLQHVSVLRTGIPSACNFGGAWNCDLVSSGEYSELFGIPISHFGTLFYALTMGLAILGMLRASYRQAIHGLLLSLAAPALLSSIGLFGLSLLVIRALCLFCTGLYVVSVALFVALLPSSGAALGGVSAIKKSLRSPAVSLFLISGLCGAVGSMLLLRQMLASQRAANALAAAMAAKAAIPETPKPGLPPLDVPYAPQMGPKDAPITLIEISDFECPHCRKTVGVVDELLKSYPGKIRLLFRNFPLDEECNPLVKRKIHEHACRAARSAYCAGQQGKFFEMAHELFDGGAEEEDHKPLARKLGLDESRFSRCLQSPEARSTIVGDISAVSQHGVRAVPIVFINNRQVKGAQPIEIYRTIIDEELAKVGK